MGKLNQKITIINQAFETLRDSISLYDEVEKKRDAFGQRIVLAARDSMIQRFEYCVDLFWKVVKLYLEEVEKMDIPMASPRGIIRQAVKSKLLSEEEGQRLIIIINQRNQTSHMYYQEIAEQIAGNIPEEYKNLGDILTRLEGRLNNKTP